MNHYLENYRYGNRLFKRTPKPETKLIVVIPCFNEPDLIGSLEALKQCIIPNDVAVEVIVIVNASEQSDELVKKKNVETFELGKVWCELNSREQIHFFIHMDNELPNKHAGVGLARKIGMDEAVDRFDQIANHVGIIACFDADATCDKNYLAELYRVFSEDPKINGASIRFEHPIEGGNYNSSIYQGITKYELFLRYYRQAFKFTGHPQAFHTVGSSMAVRSSAYQKQTGMNKRKAGEDFYFLQKIIQLGNFTEINTTRVIPSPRTSDRVPFGTGRAIAEYMDGRSLDEAYDLQSFYDIRSFITKAFEEYQDGGNFDRSFIDLLPQSVQHFLNESDFESRRKDLIQYGTNRVTFSKRFFNWFNAFRVLKFVHFCRDHHYANGNLVEQCKTLIQELDSDANEVDNEKDMLLLFREIERQ